MFSGDHALCQWISQHEQRLFDHAITTYYIKYMQVHSLVPKVVSLSVPDERLVVPYLLTYLSLPVNLGTTVSASTVSASRVLVPEALLIR
jgi:hypothetical protein